jgi:hypothetical protein
LPSGSDGADRTNRVIITGGPGVFQLRKLRAVGGFTVRHLSKEPATLTDAEVRALLDGSGRAESDMRDHVLLSVALGILHRSKTTPRGVVVEHRTRSTTRVFP